MKIVIEKDTISIFISFITLVSTIIIGYLQYYQNKVIDKRDRKRRKGEANVKAIEFIMKYDSEEIKLLPLCVIAYQYNDNFPYRRKIYREFCCLNEEIKQSVLEKQNLNFNLNKENNFYETLLNSLCLKIDDLYTKNENIKLFYEGGKYFEGALINMGNQKNPNLNLYVEGKRYKNYITDILADENNKGKKVIRNLMTTPTNVGSAVGSKEEIVISYLCCIIATYVPIYYNSKFYRDNENEDYVDCYPEENLYMEDIFLNALYKLYICLPNTQKEIE